MKKLSICLAIILIGVLLITGCGKTTPPAATTPATTKPAATTPAAPATPQPQSGGALRIISFASFTNLAYIPGGTGDHMYARPAVECLVALDPNKSPSVLPSLATGWQYSPDYKSLTFTLRKGVKFQDGTDFNAEAAKFCLDRVRKDPAGASINSITSIDVVDASTLRLNLSRFEPAFLSSLWNTGVGGMVSPTAFNTLGEELKTHAVGTGPFKYASFKRDVSLKYERYEGYWQKGKPYLDSIEWVFIADSVTQLLALKTGDAQATRRIEPKDAGALQTAGYQIRPTPSGCVSLVGDSANSSSPYANIKVRQAISYAIDSATITKAVGQGFYTAPNQIATTKNMGYNPAVAGYAYNPQKAKQLLTEAGYPNGFTTTLTLENVSTHVDACTMVQGYLKEVGIDCKLDVADRARINQVRKDGWKNQMVTIMPGCDLSMDPGTMLKNNVSNQSATVSPKSLLIPADYDTKLTQTNTEIDPQKRITMIQELHKMIIDNYCLVTPVYVSASIFASAPVVHDWDLLYDWHPENAWLSK